MNKLLFLGIIAVLLALPLVSAGTVTTGPRTVNNGDVVNINIGNGVNPEIRWVSVTRMETEGNMHRYGHSRLISLYNVGESARVTIQGPSDLESFDANFWMIDVYARIYSDEGSGCVVGEGSISRADGVSNVPIGEICGRYGFTATPEVFSTNDPSYIGQEFTFTLNSKENIVDMVEVFADTWFYRTDTVTLTSSNPSVTVNGVTTSGNLGGGFQPLLGVQQNTNNVFRFNVGGSGQVIYEIRYETQDGASPPLDGAQPPVGTGSGTQVPGGSDVRAVSFDGASSQLSGLSDISNVQNLVLERAQFGKIEFLESVDLRQSLNLDAGIVFSNGILAVNPIVLPGLVNKRVRITLRGLNYDNEPKVFRNAGFTTDANQITQECSTCSIISRTAPPTSNGVVMFNVQGFSSYKVDDVPVTIFSGLSNLDQCSSGVEGNLRVDIREPDNNEDVNPGESIEVEVEVENDAGFDMDVLVEAILFNLDDNSEEKSGRSDRGEVGGNDDRLFNLDLRVPSGVDEDERYILFVKAYEDGNEANQCNFDFVNINIDRKNHDVVFETVRLIPSSVDAGDNVQVEVGLDNKGSSNERNVYVRLLNSELGLYFRSDNFRLDSGENVRRSFSFKIPEDVESGEYLIEAIVNFNGGSESEFLILNVRGDEVVIEDFDEVSAEQVISRTPPSEVRKGFFEIFEENLFLIVLIVAVIVAFIFLLIIISL